MVLLGEGFLDGQRVAVIESQGTRHHQIHREQGLLNGIEGFQVGAFEDGLRQRAGIIRVHIDRAALQGFEQYPGAAHAQLARHRCFRCGLDALRRDFAQHIAFRKCLRTDNDGCDCHCAGRQQAEYCQCSCCRDTLRP